MLEVYTTAGWIHLGSTQVEGSQDQSQLNFWGTARPCICWSDWNPGGCITGEADTSEWGMRNHGSDLDQKNPKIHHLVAGLLAMVYEPKLSP